MTYEQKRCHFCDKTVPVKTTADGMLVFKDCFCCPERAYAIGEKLYDRLNQLPPARKREQFYLLSGWIRESVETDPNVCITDDNFDTLLESPLLPRSMEDKMDKCLLHLYRQTSGPEDMVTLPSMNHAHNMTYSPNLQEFVYIIEQLRSDGHLNRRGASLGLTGKGWEKAKRMTEMPAGRQVFITMSLEPELLEPFRQVVIPKLKESGFAPVTAVSAEESERTTDRTIAEIRNSDLVIADFTKQRQNVYFEAGFAKGLGLNVIGTVRKDQEAELRLGTSGENPIVWETPEQLADMLQEKISDFSWGKKL